MRLPENRLSAFLLFATVAAAPLPFGSTDHTAIAFWCIVLGIGVVVVSPHELRRKHYKLLSLAAGIMLAYVIVLHEQLSLHPWLAEQNPLWRKAADALGMPLQSSASIVRMQPYFALGAPLLNMLAIVCSFFVCINRDRANQLIRVVAWSGAGYAVFGIITYLVDPTHILWREKIAYRNVLTSTFINRNTAAVYFGSCAVLWLLLLLRDLRRRTANDSINWRGIPNWLLSEMPRSMALSLAMLLLCITAMLLTNSRAGIVLSFAAMVAAFTAYFYRDLSRRGGVVVAIVVGGLVTIIILQFLGGNVSGRFEIQGLSDEGRLETYRSTLKMIADYPWFGSGLGTFAWDFPAYRSDDISIWGIWDRAHSTPLELASELGLPLTSLIVISWFFVLAVLLRGIRTRRRDLILPVGAFSVAILGLSHSLIDFSLQIPGYSVVVFALVGAGLAQAFSTTDTSDQKHGSVT